MKLASKPKFYAGIVILALLGVSYFIKFSQPVYSAYLFGCNGIIDNLGNKED